MVDNVVMPEEMSLGFSGGPTFSTDKLRLKGGGMRRLKNRDDPVHVYTFTYENRSAEDVAALRDFFVDRRGDFRGFLFKDWMNFQVVGGSLGTGDGATVDFQVVQVMGTSNPYVRTIRHIKSGTLSVYLDGTPTLDFTVSATGLITIGTAPGVGVEVTADFEFYVPVAFDGDVFTEVLPHRVLSARNVSDLMLVELLGE